MASSVLKRPKQRPNLGRHGFDLSMRRVYSCPAGMLLPVFKDLAIAGDKYRINSSAFIRTEAVETAAFMQLKYHVDWFFVPMEQLYVFWSEFFYGTNDVMTSFVDPAELTALQSFQLPKASIYANMYPEAPSADHPINTVYLKTITGDKTIFTVDSFGIPKIWNAARLCDMLGYGSVTANHALQFNEEPKDLWFPMYYLAYHKIFHSHYLNTDYFANDPSFYNVDKYYDNNIPTDVISKIINTIHYRPYRRDYFTAVQPSPIFNPSWVNAVSNTPLFKGLYSTEINNESTHSSLVIFGTSSSTQTFDGSSTMPHVYTGPTVGSSSGPNAANVGTLRAMFAYERLCRITASAGSHYSDQVLAHLGVKVPEGIGKEAYYLGEQIADIVINEVVATASTTPEQAGGTLGDIAGKGFGSTRGAKDIKFTCPCDGIIMGISSIEPLVEYASNRPDIDNRYLSVFDFYRPEFDSLGMQPLWDNIACWNNCGSHSDLGNGSQYPLPIGWQPRHTELKIKYDVVNESMFATHRDNWVGFKQSLYPLSTFTPESAVDLMTMFYVCPQYTNNIFLGMVPRYYEDETLAGHTVLEYKVTDRDTIKRDNNWKNPVLQPAYMYASDNFLVNLDIKCFKTSVMTPNSLPKYI